MTELDIVAGRIICAGTFSYSGEQILTYTPILTATTTNPNVGSTGSLQGWWVKTGNLVICWGVIHFSGTGVSAGSGKYNISLPTAAIELSPLNYVGSGPMLGSGILRDDSALSAGCRQVTPRLLETFNAQSQTAEIRLSITDGSNVTVANDTPFTWAAGDRISFHCVYPAELELLT